MLLVARVHKATVPRLAREYLRITQMELAEASGLKHPTINGYEAGRDHLSPEKERKLLRFLIEQLARLHEAIERPPRHVSLEKLRADLCMALGLAYTETGDRLVAEAHRRAAHRATEVVEEPRDVASVVQALQNLPTAGE